MVGQISTVKCNDNEKLKPLNSSLQQRQNVLLNALLFATYCLRNIAKRKSDTDITANYTAEAQGIRKRQKHLSMFGSLPPTSLSSSEPPKISGDNSTSLLADSNSSGKTSICRSLCAQYVLEDNSDVYFFSSVSLFREKMHIFLSEIISLRYSVRNCCMQFMKSAMKVKSVAISAEVSDEQKLYFTNLLNIRDISKLAALSYHKIEAIVKEIRKGLEDIDITRDVYEGKILVLDKILIMIQTVVDAANNNCEFKIKGLDNLSCDHRSFVFDDYQCNSALLYADSLFKACDILRQELRGAGVIVEDLKANPKPQFIKDRDHH